jgi:hypothetical protein
MNNWTTEEVAFRCERLPLRIHRLSQDFLAIGSLSQEGEDPETTLATIRQSKSFIELTAICQ